MFLLCYWFLFLPVTAYVTFLTKRSDIIGVCANTCLINCQLQLATFSWICTDKRCQNLIITLVSVSIAPYFIFSKNCRANASTDWGGSCEAHFCAQKSVQDLHSISTVFAQRMVLRTDLMERCKNCVERGPPISCIFYDMGIVKQFGMVNRKCLSMKPVQWKFEREKIQCLAAVWW